MDARDGRRLQSSPPRLCRAKLRRPPQPPRPVRRLSGLIYRSDTDVSPKKCPVYLSDTPASSKKCLVYPADTPASPKKSRLCESLHRSGLFIHRTCKSLHKIASNKPRAFMSHCSIELNKRSVFNSTHRSGSNIHCEYKPLYISDRLIQRIFEPIHSHECDIQ